MKTVFLNVVCATVASALSLGLTPDFGSTFRSDATLKFMRGGHRTEPVAEAKKEPKNDDSEEGQEADKAAAEKEAPKAEEKAAPKTEEKAEEKAAPEAEEKADNADGDKAESEEAGPLDAVTDAIADSMKPLQQGPNADSKKAQKAADKVADKAEKAEEQAKKEEETGPLEEATQAAADAIADGMKAAQQGPNADSEEAKKEKKKEEAPEAWSKDGKKAAGKKKPAKETEVKDDDSCENSPKGWKDKKGNDCEDYAEGLWCNRHGGYGDAWLDDWGKFEDVATKGKSALQVCCVCGGGLREETEDGKPGGAPAPAKEAKPIKGPILGTKAGRPMQSQGFSGDLVVHEDQKSATSDWGREFGPLAGHRSINKICDDHPGNEWCLLHGYYDKPSGATTVKCTVVMFAALLLACLS